jgi:hypothetical protein
VKFYINFSSNPNAYKFRIVEMKDQKESLKLDTFDGIYKSRILFISNSFVFVIENLKKIFFVINFSQQSIEHNKSNANR